MSNCPKLELAGLLLDNELSERERAEYRKHIEECASCAGELKYLQRLSATLLDMPAQPGAKNRILVALEAAPVRPPHSRRFAVPLPAAAAILATLALSLTANVYFGLRQEGEKSFSRSQPGQAVSESAAAPKTPDVERREAGDLKASVVLVNDEQTVFKVASEFQDELKLLDAPLIYKGPISPSPR